jgi:hypothetical protein
MGEPKDGVYESSDRVARKYPALRQQAEFYLRGDNGIYRLVPLGTDGIYHSRVLTGLWLKVECLLC